MKQRTIFFAATIFSVVSTPIIAGEREDIIARWRAQMGEYGSAMVKACANQDIEALNALPSYPEKAKPFIARCHRQMSDYGWSMVKACADQDIEAEKALDGY
jgi:hypothetical protein